MNLDPPIDARRLPWHDRPGVPVEGGRLYSRTETAVVPVHGGGESRAAELEARVVGEVARVAWAEGHWVARPTVERRWTRLTMAGSSYTFAEVAPATATHVEVRVEAVGAPRAAP